MSDRPTPEASDSTSTPPDAPPSEATTRDDRLESGDDDLGIDANEELRVGDASMNADRGDG